MFARTEPGSVGQFVLDLRQAMLQNRPCPLRTLLDLPAMAQLGMSALPRQREDVAMEYNLLADPALPLRVALSGAQVSAAAECTAGDGLDVTVRYPQARTAEVTVQLAMRRNQTAAVAGMPAEDGRLDEAAMDRRHEMANRKTIAQVHGQLIDGVAHVRLAIPADLPAGEYGIGAVLCTGERAVGGSTSIRVAERAATAPASSPPPQPKTLSRPARSAAKFD
jgi:hypothetical protein